MKKTCSIFVVLLLAIGIRAAAPETNSYVNFSFDQADIRLLVKLVGEMTGKRFIVDDTVAGKVTVISPPRIPMEEVYPLFVTVLESTGYSVVEKSGIYHIVALPTKKAVAPVVVEGDQKSSQGVITKVLRIHNVSSLEIQKILEPLVRAGKEGGVEAFGPSNHLIITDTAEHIHEMEKIIAELDRPGASRVMEVVELKHTSADELARQLVTAMSGAASSKDRIGQHMQKVVDGTGSLPSDIVVVPVSQANRLVLVGTPVQLAEMKRVVQKIDIASPTGHGRLNAIFLKYLTAEEAAKNLNDLFAKTAEKSQRNPIAIEFNKANNALIVDASPQDFEVVKKLIDELDIIPQQVMVEILIAEVAEDKNLNLGVEFSTVDLPDDGETTIIGRSRPGESDLLQETIESGLFPRGLSIGVAEDTFVNAAGVVVPRVPVLVHALAQNRDVKILSNVPLLAQNNTEASVSVVENIPILRSTIEGGSGTARDVIQNIDRLDVGIKLKLTPHVNPDKEILLQLNPSIEAIVDEGPTGTQFAPTIAKREVSTTVTVPDRATVVLSGLIREDRIKTVSKIPWLGDIPLIGWLFRNQSEAVRRTNLMILVTPYIVTDQKAAQKIKKSLEERSGVDVESSMQKPAKRKKKVEPI